MNKASMAVLVGVAAVASSGLAEAQSPTTTPAAITAQTASAAATAAIQKAGKAELISPGVLGFAFTPAGLTCVPGTTKAQPELCTDQVSGTYRFVLRVTDIRPGSTNGKSTVIGTFLTTEKASTPISSLTCAAIPGSTATGGCPLTIRPKGVAIFQYATSNNLSVPTQLITHIRPTGSATSIEVLQGLNL
jgi:hypothetical protein